MAGQRISRAQLRAFAYLSTLFPEIDLVVVPIHEEAWDSLYVLAFGGHEYCRARGVRASLTMECMPDGRFTVVWQSEDGQVIDEIMAMVEEYGRDPFAVGRMILLGQYAPRTDGDLPDHMEAIECVRDIITGGDDEEPGIVWSHEVEPHEDEVGGMQVHTHDSGRISQIAPEFDYWRNYWNLPSRGGRPN